MKYWVMGMLRNSMIVKDTMVVRVIVDRTSNINRTSNIINSKGIDRDLIMDSIVRTIVIKGMGNSLVINRNSIGM